MTAQQMKQLLANTLEMHGWCRPSGSSVMHVMQISLPACTRITSPASQAHAHTFTLCSVHVPE